MKQTITIFASLLMLLVLAGCSGEMEKTQTDNVQNTNTHLNSSTMPPNQGDMQNPEIRNAPKNDSMMPEKQQNNEMFEEMQKISKEACENKEEGNTCTISIKNPNENSTSTKQTESKEGTCKSNQEQVLTCIIDRGNMAPPVGEN